MITVPYRAAALYRPIDSFDLCSELNHVCSRPVCFHPRLFLFYFAELGAANGSDVLMDRSGWVSTVLDAFPLFYLPLGVDLVT